MATSRFGGQTVLGGARPDGLFRGRMGDPAGADRLYAEAEDELTAKEMRSFAWLEVQRGFLHFTRGRFAEAWSHYRRADAAYPGWWLAAEHIAELLAAEDKYFAAIAILEPLAAAVRRPDLEQAIGELYELIGQTDRARHWAAKALAGYLQSRGARRGAFLAPSCRLLCGSGTGRGEGGRMGAAGFGLRRELSTQAALAWALYRAARFDEARHWSEQRVVLGRGRCPRSCCRPA